MSQRNSDVSAQVKAELTCAAENVPFTPGQARACTVREVLDRVGGKWSISILVSASHGPVRFTELERNVEGISRRMLTLTLRNLERDGLLHARSIRPSHPRSSTRRPRWPWSSTSRWWHSRAGPSGTAGPSPRRGPGTTPSTPVKPRTGVGNATTPI